MIQFIVTVKNDFRKVLLRELSREQLLGACRMEDTIQTNEEEKTEVLTVMEYYFNNITFITNGHIGSRYDALDASFFYITASPDVRHWVEEKNEPFGITLELDLEEHTANLQCSSIEDWMKINRLIPLNDFRNPN